MAWWVYLLASLAWGAPDTTGLRVELTKPSVYLGKGPEETGLPGISASAQVYEFEVRARFDLSAQLPEGTPQMQRDTALRWFDQVARDYTYYPFVSPLIREAYGVRVDASDTRVTPIDFIRKLVAATSSSRSRPILTDRRVHQLAMELAHPEEIAQVTFGDCVADVQSWLWRVAGAEGVDGERTPDALRTQLRSLSGDTLRTRIAETPSSGCRRSAPRDYLFMSFGVPSGAPGGWLIAELDFTGQSERSKSLDPHQRYLPSVEVAGPIHFFDGRYVLDYDADSKALEVTYGYRMDLSRWPERIVTRYHERVIIDFVHALHERFIDMRGNGQLQ